MKSGHGIYNKERYTKRKEMRRHSKGGYGSGSGWKCIERMTY